MAAASSSLEPSLDPAARMPPGRLPRAPQAPAPSAGGAGAAGSGIAFSTLFGLLLASLAALALQRSTRLRLVPPQLRPLAFVAVIERPG